MASLVIFTIGHSTRAIAAFIRVLRAHGVQRVIDVRTMPRSRHNLNSVAAGFRGYANYMQTSDSRTVWIGALPSRNTSGWC